MGLRFEIEYTFRSGVVAPMSVEGYGVETMGLNLLEKIAPEGRNGNSPVMLS